MNQISVKLQTAAEKMRQACEQIKSVPGMATQAAALAERAERLEQNRFTIALFGAFSAGKSSFANAMMGDLVLPVSPNPTTAAINKILPPTDNFPHGTVKVVLKQRDTMEADVLASLAVFDLQADDMESGLAAVQQIDITRIAPAAKPHYTFLKAVIKGLPEMGDQLGKELLVDMQAFKGFVAKEEKACFADHIELYYDCPLTRQGIVLVDTPGADSINARHTGVAFDYMKNADAVLFVTYYNHAFAQADREFLLQMGRVKDTFELDKMFFLVNAADLAHSPEELQDVVEHVEKNLLSCGIRLPRIYPVSSQTALLARMNEQGKLSASAEKIYRQRTKTEGDQPLPSTEEALQLAGLQQFEADFFRFIGDDLAQMAVDAAHAELKRAYDTVSEFVQLAQQGEQERNQRRQVLQQEREAALAAVSQLQAEALKRELQREQEELQFHVKQRLFFRFQELYNFAFNPAVLKDDGQNIKKALQLCLQEFLRSVGYHLAQEMRATSLRLEKYINQSGGRLLDQWRIQLKELISGLTLAPFQPYAVDTPDFPQEMSVANPGSFQSALSMFKNAKQFFEQDGKAKMGEELEKLLHSPVDQYLAEQGERLRQVFGNAFDEMVAAERKRVEQQVEEFFTGLLAALEMKLDLAELTTKQQALGQLLS